MHATKHQNQSGFSIIEVLIVLAIVALLLLIIFIAVPTLQRSARNTQRKNDVQTMYSAIEEYKNKNNNKLPASQEELNKALDGAGLSYYTLYSPVAAYQPSGTFNNTRDDKVTVVFGNRCSVDEVTNEPDGNSVEASQKGRYVILYSIETRASNSPRCFGLGTNINYL